MSLDAKKKWKCNECNEISLETELLYAKSPFDETDTLTGCPKCKGCNGFDEICDEPGCDRTTSCGFPAGDEWGGYRRTCHEHSDWAKERK